MKALWTLLGAYTLLWGAWIGNPFWDAFSARAGLYDEMADFMPEWAWGLHASIIGFAILYGVWHHWPRGLVWGHVAGVYHWGLIAVLYAAGDWRNTGAITALFLAVSTHMLWRSTKPKPAVVKVLDV